MSGAGSGVGAVVMEVLSSLTVSQIVYDVGRGVVRSVGPGRGTMASGGRMQFHHHGYVSGDPRVQPAAGTGIDRPSELPDEVDVLIVGSGPAGMLLAAQMSQFPNLTTRVIERRSGRLTHGQADGIQPRSVETFQAFGFAEPIIAEAYNIGWMNFWSPDPENP